MVLSILGTHLGNAVTIVSVIYGALACVPRTVLDTVIRSDQSLSCVQLFVIPWIAARQASLSITNSWSSLKLMSNESVMPSSHLILCRPLLLLPPIPPSIKVFSNESTLCMRCPKYWSFSFSIIPSKEHPGLISFRMDWLIFLNLVTVLHLKSILSDVKYSYGWLLSFCCHLHGISFLIPLLLAYVCP